MLSCYGIETHSPPSPRIGHSIHYLKKRKEIILFGGASIEEGTSNEIYIYNILKNTWTKNKVVYQEVNGKLSKIPEPRYEHTGIIIENENGEEELFIFGGTTGNKLLNDSFIFNFTSNGWREIKTTGDIPTPRSINSGVYVNNEYLKNSIVIFGGSQYNTQPVNDSSTYILNLDSMEWKKYNIIPSPSIRLGHTVTYNPINSEIYLFGGMNNGEVYNDLWKLNCCSLKWEKITDDEKNSPKGRSGHTAVIDSNNLYIFGGMQHNPPHVFEDINLYSILEKKWKVINPVLCTSESYKPRLGLASCLVGSPKTRTNTKLLMASEGESTFEGDVNQEDKKENTSNEIQEIRFDEENAYLENITKNNTVKNIALFGGADFYGIYNDLYLMKL
ncbi:galactose oxidase [Piromyces finnis]|uniref:Galactose oxidase n=1 Tax=Piromyces finnis TaxID=1754191 RepID=A0A1Y1V5Y0_9FUNG|nr:galactose oxidase [Piromyces finnis]|eukprot:ORX48089.1 galactose oxidase [Piromyces finnis]